MDCQPGDISQATYRINNGESKNPTKEWRVQYLIHAGPHDDISLSNRPTVRQDQNAGQERHGVYNRPGQLTILEQQQWMRDLHARFRDG